MMIDLQIPGQFLPLAGPGLGEGTEYLHLGCHRLLFEASWTHTAWLGLGVAPGDPAGCDGRLYVGPLPGR